jgi:hypothetical protein
VLARGLEDRLRDALVVEPDAEPEARALLRREKLDVSALLGRGLEVVARRQQQLAAGEPGGRVLVL